MSDVSQPIRNPIWRALTTRHASLALGAARARRYPGDVAPFIAVPDVMLSRTVRSS